MSLDEKAKAKFDALIKEGNEILRAAGWDGSKYHHHSPSNDDYMRFRTEAANLTKRICGEDSFHYQELQRIAGTPDTASNGYYFPLVFGVLQAAQKDFEDGFLFDVRSLVAADLLGDFIEQAEHLLEAGFHNPAASLAGAILEDTLRKICEKHSIEVPEKTNINKLNSNLAKAEVYTKLTAKNITAYADIRNNADHGKFTEYSLDDVRDMVSWVRRFTEASLS